MALSSCQSLTDRHHNVAERGSYNPGHGSRLVGSGKVMSQYTAVDLRNELELVKVSSLILKMRYLREGCNENADRVRAGRAPFCNIYFR
jgi:hypothetical protein